MGIAYIASGQVSSIRLNAFICYDGCFGSTHNLVNILNGSGINAQLWRIFQSRHLSISHIFSLFIFIFRRYAALSLTNRY